MKNKINKTTRSRVNNTASKEAFPWLIVKLMHGWTRFLGEIMLICILLYWVTCQWLLRQWIHVAHGSVNLRYSKEKVFGHSIANSLNLLFLSIKIVAKPTMLSCIPTLEIPVAYALVLRFAIMSVVDYVSKLSKSKTLVVF